MKKIVKLTENDLTRIVKKVIKEQVDAINPKLSRLKNMIQKKYPSVEFIDGYSDEELIIYTSRTEDEEDYISTIKGVFISLPYNEDDPSDFVWGDYTEIIYEDGEVGDIDSDINYGGSDGDLIDYLGKYLKGSGEPYIQYY